MLFRLGGLVAFYDLDRLSIFIVEDNSYIRFVLERLLRQYKVGHLDSAPNGADAIEFFKKLHADRQAAGAREFDIVISDLVMSPVNGLLFLRWMRGAKESPNRFIPFIMLSGAADIDYVAAARDLGSSEFLAKPFSAHSVYRRLLEVIDYPRQFVANQAYFGPDRRRKNAGPPEGERRVTREKDVTVVYSGDRIVKPQKPTEVWYFRLPNALKSKVGGLGASGAGEIPADLLEEAEQQLERSALDFTEWARNYLSNLASLCEEAKAQTGTRRKYFEEINLLAHELRGQGGTFGYPLITTFGKMLYDVTGSQCREDDNAVEIVKAHIDAMRAVLREKVSGDGGEIGNELLRALKAAIERYSVVE
jgi:CheY-like chemotaxis protein